jgi:hypothetical protein
MAGEKNFARIPPDSTGKRVRVKLTAQVLYTAKTPGYVWKIGEHYKLPNNNTMHVHGVYETSSTDGVLEVHYSKKMAYTNDTISGAITDPDTNAQIATVSEVRDVFINSNHIIGYDNPEHGLDIDNTGSANVRFAEGLPQLDAFGKLRVTGATLLGEYIFANGTLPTQFSSTTESGGTIGWDNNTRALVVTTDTTASSHAATTSNTYHHYFPGSSHLFIGTFAVGDAGKANVIREWGMFDDKNGFMFKLNGTTLGVNIRSNVSGSIVDTFIAQNDWNQDVADGTGPSQMDLDVTKDNIYWIDVQWLGAGRVRFGTYNDGQRLVLHEYYHGNTFAYPVSAMGSLPVCVYQHNTGIAASISQIRAWCMALWTESDLDVRQTASSSLKSFNVTTSSANDVYTYVGTLSPKELLPNGQPNRSLYWPTEIEASGWDTTTGAPAIFELEIYAEPIINGLSWQSIPGSTAEYDTSGTFIASGITVSQRFIQGRDALSTVDNFNNMQYGAFKNYSEDGGTVVQPITSVTKASTAVATMTGARTYFRNAEPLTISGATGMTQLNGNTYYAKPVSATTIELYTDEALTTPLNSTAFGTYTGSGIASGTFGPKFHFGILVKKLYGNNPAKIYVKVAWKELTQ